MSPYVGELRVLTPRTLDKSQQLGYMVMVIEAATAYVRTVLLRGVTYYLIFQMRKIAAASILFLVFSIISSKVCYILSTQMLSVTTLLLT